MGVGIAEVTSQTFEVLVTESARPVIIEFWGPRCRPCVALRPVYEELAERCETMVRFLKVEAPANRMLCATLKVLSLPTFLYLESGREVDRLVGDMNGPELRAWVERVIERVTSGGAEANA